MPLGSFSFSRSWDTVHQKVLINLLCGITLRSTFVRAPSYGVFDTADYRQRINSAAQHFDS